MAVQNPLTVTYSSGITIDRPDEIATLSVFYDAIWLPYPYDLDPNGVRLTHSEAPPDDEFKELQEEYFKWRENWTELFQGGVLNTLPPVDVEWSEELTKTINEVAAKLPPKHPLGLSLFVKDRSGRNVLDPVEFYRGKLQLAVHAALTPKKGPELFISNPSDTDTARLAGFLAQSVFTYQVPQLAKLTPEQILETRESVHDVREGFRDYLFELADDLEGRLKNGTASEVEAARRIVERKVLPKYHEFQRLLEARKAGFLSRVLATTGKLFKIDATPLQPKFWGELFEIVYGEFAEEAKDRARSNADSAFQFIARVERVADKS